MSQWLNLCKLGFGGSTFKQLAEDDDEKYHHLPTGYQAENGFTWTLACICKFAVDSICIRQI